MSNVLKDGTGKAFQAKVGDKNRLHTHSLAADISAVASISGDAFNVSSNLVTLTNTSESVLLYFKNLEEDDISITTEFVNIGTSTGAGSTKGIMKFYIDGTSGTIIDNALPAQVINRRIGNGNTLDGNIYRGVQGDTLTGGDTITIPTSGGAIASEYILPKGKSFALSYTPAAGNTSISLQIGFLIIKSYSTYTVD